jgi:hypothetical protein
MSHGTDEGRAYAVSTGSVVYVVADIVLGDDLETYSRESAVLEAMKGMDYVLLGTYERGCPIMQARD